MDSAFIVPGQRIVQDINPSTRVLNHEGIASYTRYSSDKQDASSVEQQDVSIATAANTRGQQIDRHLAFSDEAVSGTKLRRDGLDRMMEAARQGRIKVLYVYSLSRLARECLIALMLLKELVQMQGVLVISVSEGIDSNNPTWDLISTLLSAMHEEFLKVLRAQVFRGQTFNLDNDFSCGDWGFGYKSVIIPGQENTTRFNNGKPRKRVEIDQEQAEIVRQVFYWFVHEQHSIRRITLELTRRGIAKEHGGRTPAWHHNSVRGMLSNPKYIGYWQWGKSRNQRNPKTGQIIKVPRSPEEIKRWFKHIPKLRIIDDATFYVAQARLEQLVRKFVANRRKDGRFKGSTNDHSQPRHLLQGAIRCAKCNSVFKTSGGLGHRL